MSEKKFKLITKMTVSEYKCGLKSGNFVRLKKQIVVKNHKGKPTGEIPEVGEIWRVVNGSKEEPIVVWFRRINGEFHTWDDDGSIFDWFELINDEIFDVVNDRDEVIDRKPRSEVHRLGLNHRAVHILVFNSRGEVFLQKRSMKKDRHPGVWDSSASGHVDSGEGYDASAVRELDEEIGLKITKPLQRLFKIPASAETDQEFVWVYRCENDGPFMMNEKEIERGEWFSPEHVTRWIQEQPQDFAPAFVFLWTKFRE